MKFKRLLAAILSALMIVSCFSFVASAQDTVVETNKIYISDNGDDENDGLTADTPVLNLAAANTLLAADDKDTLVIVGSYTICKDQEESYGKIDTLGVEGKTITVIGDTTDAVFNMDRSYYAYDDAKIDLAGPVTFTAISLAGENNDGFLRTNGHKLVVESDVKKSGTKAVRVVPGANVDAEIVINGGEYQVVPAGTSNSSVANNTKLTINGTDSTYIGIGKGNYGAPVYSGTFDVTLNGGTVSSITLRSNGTGASNGYKGLRYYTLNGGTVASIVTTASASRVNSSTDKTEVAVSARTGATVFEINKAGIVTGDISLGKNEFQSRVNSVAQYDEDDATRIILFNNNSYASYTGTIGDTAAITANVIGGALKADVTVAEDYTTTLNGYTFTAADEAYDQVTITPATGDAVTYKLADITAIPADALVSGTNKVEFSKYVEAPTTADYTVETYTMDTTGAYGAPVVATVEGAEVGTTATYTPEAKSGFTVDTDASVLSGTVAADGSLVLKVYYTRNQYKLYTKASADAEAVEVGTYYYEAAVTAPGAIYVDGYTFKGWETAAPATMPANDVTVVAKQEAYTVIDSEKYEVLIVENPTDATGIPESATFIAPDSVTKDSDGNELNKTNAGDYGSSLKSFDTTDYKTTAVWFKNHGYIPYTTGLAAGTYNVTFRTHLKKPSNSGVRGFSIDIDGKIAGAVHLDNTTSTADDPYTSETFVTFKNVELSENALIKYSEVGGFNNNTIKGGDLLGIYVWQPTPETVTLTYYDNIDNSKAWIEKTVDYGATVDIVPLMSEHKATYGISSSANNIAAHPARVGYWFKGWASTPDATAAETVVATADKSYYAVWEEATILEKDTDYTLTVVDGTVVTASPVPTDATAFQVGGGANSDYFKTDSHGRTYGTNGTYPGVSGATYGSYYSGMNQNMKTGTVAALWYKYQDGGQVQVKPGVTGKYNVAYHIFSDGSESAASVHANGRTRGFYIEAGNVSGTVHLAGCNPAVQDNFVMFQANFTEDSVLAYSAARDFDDVVIEGAQFLGVYIWPVEEAVTTATATFDANGGTWADCTTKTVETTIGETPVAPENPTRAEYTFAGWDPELGAITADGATYKAKWTAVPRTFENAVYVGDAGDDANDGLTPTTLVKTLKAAQTIVLANADIDKIVIVGTYSKTNDGAALDNYLKGANRKITITGYDVESVFDMRYVVDGANKDSHLRIQTDIEFNNIKLYGSSKDGGIMSMGYELTFGENVVLAGNYQNVGFLHYNAQYKDNGVVNLMSGAYNKVDLAVQSGVTYKGTSTINISGTASTKITNGHGWQGIQSVYGINNVNIDGGNVSSITLSSTADTAVTNYSGLRYFTINGGTVGNIATTGSSVSKKYTPSGGTETYKETSARAGVTVIEINGGTVGNIALGTNKQTSAADPDDATRVVILNNGMTANVTDTGAIIVKTTGGKLSAATNAQETYPEDYTTIGADWGKAVVLKGFTYVLPENSTANAVKVDGGEAVLLTALENDLITGITAAGEHTVEFVTVDTTVGTIVYLSDNGDDTADGLTADTAVKTIAKAMEIMDADEKLVNLVIVDKFTASAKENTLGVAGRTITITGNTSAAVFSIDWPIDDVTHTANTDDKFTLAGPVVFENIAIAGDNNDGRITTNGHKLVFGDGVTGSGKALNVAVEANKVGAEIEINSGNFARVFPGRFSGGTFTGSTTITVDGDNTAIAMMGIGHGWKQAQYFSGTYNAIINGGTITNISIQSGGTGNTADNGYRGLRYYTINDGTVSNIVTTSSPVWQASGATEFSDINYRQGVTVFEINKAGVVTGTIKRGFNIETKEDADDDATRIILFNNGSYEDGKVLDEGAITVDVQNGALKADVTVGEDGYTTTLNGYTFTTDKSNVYINGKNYAVTEFVETSEEEAALAADEVTGTISADLLTAGDNTVIFTDAALVTVKWVVGDTTTEELLEVGSALTAPETTKAPDKDYYYTFKAWNDGTADVDLATYTVPEAGATLTAVYTSTEMPASAIKEFTTFSQVNNAAGIFTATVETIDGVEAVKVTPTADGTVAINLEGSGNYPVNYSTGKNDNIIDPAIYDYVVIKYYYVPGTNTETRNLEMWYQKHPWTDATLVAPDSQKFAMDELKWTYLVDKLDRADGKTPDLSSQYHIRPMQGVTASDLAANGEYVYIDSMQIFKAEPTVATVTFADEAGAALYAVDALNSEAVTFNGTQPAKDGYTFNGWAVSGTTEVVEALTFAEDTTLVPVFEQNEVETPEETAEYKTYGEYDAEAGTYTIKLMLSGVKAHTGSFGFELAGLNTVTANTAADISLFAEEAAEGAIVSPIFAKDDGYYANTWAVEVTPGFIDATNEEILIATFVLDMDETARAEFLEELETNSGKLKEYAVENADAKYHNGENYLVAPIADSLATEKVAVVYTSHTDSVKEVEAPELSYKTYGTYDPVNGTYNIEVKFSGGKINAGAFGLAFNPEHMTYDPATNEDGSLVNVTIADGIANYLGIVPANSANGVAFTWDGSANSESGFVDATENEVLIATIKTTMSEEQRAAFEDAGKTMNILDLKSSDVEEIEKLYDGTNYLVALYSNDLSIDRVAAPYNGHEDTELEITTADVTVKVTFSEKLGATVANLGYITVNGGKPIVIDATGNTEETVEYVIKNANVGEKLAITVEKNGYVPYSLTVDVKATGHVVEIAMVAGDIKESVTAISGDGEVSLDDFIRIVRAFDNATDDYKATVDIDENGGVNVTDLNVIKTNFGNDSSDVVVKIDGELVVTA